MSYPPLKVEDGNSLDWDSRGSQKQLCAAPGRWHMPRCLTAVGCKFSRPFAIPDFEKFDAEIGRREWFKNEAINDFVQAVPDTLGRAFAASSRDDDRTSHEIGMRSRAGGEFPAAHGLHFEVGEDEVVCAGLQLFQRTLAALADINVGVAKLPDDALHDAGHGGKVIHHQNCSICVGHELYRILCGSREMTLWR